MTDRLVKLDRRYKCCKVLKWLLFAISLATAFLPAVFVAFKVAPSMPKVTPAVGLAGVGMFILAIGLLFIIGGLNKRYGHKLPWATLTVLLSWVLYCFLYAMQRIIVQSVQISLALAAGSSVAFVLSLGSELCGVLEKAAEEEYKRLK